MSPKSLRHIAIVALPGLVFLLVWQILSLLFPSSRFIFSSPALIGAAFYRMAASGDLFYHLTITAGEAIAGFVLGTVTGTLLGLGLAFFPRAAAIGRPYILALGSLPIFALAPVTIMWFGIGFMSKVMMAALSTVFVAFVQAAQGAQSVDAQHVRYFQLMKASRQATFFKLVVPSALVWVVNSMKLNIGFALMGAFIGEFVASQAGLGHVIVRAAGLFDMASVFTGCLVLMALALALGGCISWVERRLLHWKYL